MSNIYNRFLSGGENVLTGKSNKTNPALFAVAARALGIFLIILTSTGSVFCQTTVTASVAGNYTFPIPCGVTSITVECWGAGGGGARRGTSGVGGGGGGGAYSSSTISVTPGQAYNVVVGAGGAGTAGTAGGDTYFNSSTTVMAKGGTGVPNNIAAGAAGGLAAQSVGTITRNGGTGGTGSGTNAGGGGGAAGNANPGGTGGAPTAGIGGSVGGGNGGAGRSVSVGVGSAAANTATTFGGGGGGAYSAGTVFLGGAGADGAIKITYTAIFPAYCTPTFTTAIEPITNVTFAGINNTTPASSTLDYEYFCSPVAVVTAGLSYPISIKGNTGGTFTDYVTVFADWNKDGFFTGSNERYEIGTITSSTGADAITASGSILVPATASIGTTVMRVMKNYNAVVSGPCQAGANYGQAEDYLVNISAPPPPTITSLGSASVCVGGSITINGTNLTGATAANVKIGGVAVASISSNSGSVLVAVTSTVSSGNVTVTIGSNTATSAATFSVNAVPVVAAIAGGAASVCTGATTPAFTDATPAGVWSVTNGTGTATIDAATGIVTGTGAGNVTVVYTVTSGGCSAAKSTPLAINAVPGTPVTPSPLAGSAGVCYFGTGAVSTISWAATVGAISYDVYFGPGTLPGTFTNVTTNSFNTGALSAATVYHWKVVAKNSCGGGVPSAEWTFTTSSAPCYCPSVGQTTDGISGVTFNTISNLNTLNSGYTDYSASKNTSISQALTYTLNVYVNTGGSFTNYQTAYIDWNRNGSFADAGESYSLGTATAVTNGLSSLSPLSITVPAGATLGETRMRIISRYNAAPTGPCQTGFDGETEDYALTILATPVPTITSLGAASSCVGGNIIINGTNFTGVTAANVQIGGVAVSSITSNTGTVITAVTGTAASGLVTVMLGSNTATSAANYTVYALPVVAAIAGGSSTVCVGASTAAFTNTTSGGTWSVTNGTGTASITSGGVVTGNTAGTVTINYTVSTNGCSTTKTAALTVLPVPVAATTPVPSTGTTGICYSGPGTLASLSWAAVPGATSYDIYFGAGTLPGTVTANVSTNAFTPATLLSNTVYHWKVVAKNNCGTAAGSVEWTFTTSSTACYCIPSNTVNTIYYINAVSTTGGITNFTNAGSGFSAGGYGSFLNKSVSGYQGLSTITLTAVHPVASNTYKYGVWVDWNQDGDFDDAGETVLTSGYVTSPASGSFLVPVSALAGNTRLRIRNSYLISGTVPSCGSDDYGETEDYTFTVVVPPACTGTPVGGTAVLTPATGASGSTFVASASGYTLYQAGLTYQWQSSVDGNAPWTDIAGATTVPATITSVSAIAVTYYRLKVTCSNTGLSGYSNTVNFTTTYCAPVAANDPSAFYISRIAFIGTLNDVTNNSTYTTGYQDFTGNTKASQAQGQGINISIQANLSVYMKAWIDWNRDGQFDELTEEVYNSNDISTASTTFGFIIPGSTTPGNYRIRLKINNANNTYSPCTSTNKGETEDYLFTVIAYCPSAIASITNGEICTSTSGAVTLNVTGNTGTTQYRWYAAANGGSPLATTSAGTWVTPVINTTTTYYVTAYNGTCESLSRTAIVAKVNPIPVLSFTNTNPTVCGEAAVVSLNATGDTEQGFLINENFEGTGLGSFTLNNISTRIVTNANNGVTRAATATEISEMQWQNQTSPLVPAYTTVWRPAISSGFGSNKFAFTTSDIQDARLVTAIESATVNSTSFTNLTLSYDLFYSRYYPDGYVPPAATAPALTNADSLNVEISVDGGANWNVLSPGLADVGVGTKFATVTMDLTSYINKSNLKIRFKYHGDWADGAAIDNIKLFGTKPLASSFSWSPATNGNLFKDAAGTIPYTGGSVPNIFIKPTSAQVNAGTDLVFTASATLSNGCTASAPITIHIGPNSWTGAFGSDWNNTGNWCANLLPGASTKVEIPAGVPNYPVLSTTATARMIKILAGASLTINSGAVMSVKEDLNNVGTLINDGILRLDGNIAQNFPGPGIITKMKNLEIANTNGGVILNNSVEISGELKPESGTLSLGAFDITLKSTAANTAFISAMGGSAAFNYNGAGRFVVERYINTGTAPGQHGKGWQLLSVPTNGQTIKDSWMEGGGALPGPANGFGTITTGAGGSANGYDLATPTPSMKYYEPLTDKYISVSNPSTTQLNYKSGYLLFVRGDRSVYTYNGTPVPTTLRSRGMINTGSKTLAIPANKFFLAGNPYPAPVDFSLITKNPFTDAEQFYVWDPTLYGAYNLGGYQTIYKIGSAWSAIPGSTITYPSGGDYRHIQSGQAFFVHATGASDGALTFQESHKSAAANTRLATRGGGDQPSNGTSDINPAVLSSNLLALSNGNTSLADGNLLVLDPSYNNGVDGQDAVKIPNDGENFGLERNQSTLSVEARQPAITTDTVFYNMTHLKQQPYRLVFVGYNMDATMSASLIDKFLNTRADVNLADTTYIDFNVTSDAASSAADRFMIVFTKPAAGPLPVTFTGISATRNPDRSISVKWTIDNEINITRYDIERSANGLAFVGILNTAATSSTFYAKNDLSPLAFDNYYRIKATGNDGKIQYSAVVRVAPIKFGASISVYPNPVIDKTLQVQFINQKAGSYKLELTNKLGQVVYAGEAGVTSSTFVKTIKLNSSTGAGAYQLKIVADAGAISTEQIIIE